MLLSENEIWKCINHLSPISRAIQVRRTRHAGNCWRNKDELKSDIFLWTPTHDGRLERTYFHQLCEDSWYCLEDQKEAIDNEQS